MEFLERLLAIIYLLGLSQPAFAQSITTGYYQGHLPADSLFKLVYVPVKVPAGVTEIRVKETYDHPGKNVLNLGIYGPRGPQPGPTAGFRGWSGGAKTEFFLNAQAASMGYVPGRIMPGTWHLLIYASTILPAGV